MLNARDARWRPSPGRGAYCKFEGEPEFSQLGIHLIALAPGEPMAMYHWEANQEDFLVLDGEALLIVEGEERPLRQWDFVHCPVGNKARHRRRRRRAVPGARCRRPRPLDRPGLGWLQRGRGRVASWRGRRAGDDRPEAGVRTIPERESARYRDGWLPG